jgi:LmbE family N-acetylglucosaminyl deacetylase
MREFGISDLRGGFEKILCLGAHSDDIEIGCGGTIREIVKANPGIEVTWVVFSAHGEREREARLSAKRFLGGKVRREIIIQKFRDGYFPSQTAEIKDFFEAIKIRVDPDVVFTHYREDRHQDHRVLSDLAWNTFRNHLILEYEIPKYDGDLGTPNLYVPIAARVARSKARELCAIFRTQANHHWFTEDLFTGLMRIRGVECGSSTGFAEAFYSRKAILAPNSSLSRNRARRITGAKIRNRVSR